MNKKSRIKDLILDLFYPRFCLGCKKDGDWVCEECYSKILKVSSQVCPSCGRISKKGRYCKKDTRTWGAAGIIVSAYYEEGPLKELIHNFKYNHIFDLKEILADLMVESLRNNMPAKKKNIIFTAVPMHFLKKAQRGYNQSEILAEEVAEKLKMQKNFQIIKKFRKTKPQMKLSGKNRTKNLVNSYKIINKMIIKSKTIILVDDVTTTGTTINECAKVLRKAGAKKVWGLVIAKG